MNTSLSVLHLTTFLQGGAGRAIADLACAQLDAGHRVCVVTSETGEDGYGNYPHHLTRLREAGVPVMLVDSLFKRDPALNDRVLDRIASTLPDGSADVVHAHAGVPARIGLRYAGRVRRRPAVLQTQHGWGTNKTSDQAQQDLSVLGAVDRVIVTSSATADVLSRLGLDPTQFVVLPCGVSPETAGIVPPEADKLIAPLRAHRYRVIGCVGSVTPNKNQVALLEALVRMDARVAAVLVGEGGERLERQIAALGLSSRVRVAGYQPDAADWMPLFDVLVVPSLTEGQGLVALEAFSRGVPVVASDIAPLRALVEEGATGWLFDPRDPATLASALTRALSASAADRAHVVDAARARVRALESVQAVAARHEALYRGLLRKSGG
jgi:glycosyltransferase involved in cell wall biosynthesis